MKEDDFASYKDISELKKELEGKLVLKSPAKKELDDPIAQLLRKIDTLMEIFAAASEQMKMGDGTNDDSLSSKLDRIIEQNKTIAEAMVSIAETVKTGHHDEPVHEEPAPFRAPRQDWANEPMMPVPPSEPIMQRQNPMQAQQMNPMPAGMPEPEHGMSDFGNMPPMESSPPDFNFPEDDFSSDQPKKKGLFGMFKK